MTGTIAYHFTRDTLRDGRPVPPIGKELRHNGSLKMCSEGLHASEHPFDALKYAPGNMLHKVRCFGRIEFGHDKLVCSRRVILATIDAEYLLRRFAADQALSVVHLWDAPKIVHEYLTTLDPSIRDVARAAAWAAARDAAMYAAWDAAWAAARGAAGGAAWDAARGAARAAAWDAAWAAAWDAAADGFKRRVETAFAEAMK